MKLKHILLSGLCVAAFAACTNDDFEDQSVPVAKVKGIDLGQVNVTLTKDAADTRIGFVESGNDVLSSWARNDMVGAACFAVQTDEKGETGILTTGDGGKYYTTNAIYARTDSADGTWAAKAEFTTLANMMAGKYTFYYPYDGTASTRNKIPVNVKMTQTMDCANPFGHIADPENYFAYKDVAFTTGGQSTSNEFNLSSVNVLYGLKFAAAENNTDVADLVGATVMNVILEATTDVNGGAFYSDGALKVSNNTFKDAKSVYAGGTAASVINLVVEGGDAEGYQITKAGKDGATANRFYVSSLPVNKDIKSLTIKVVTDAGTFTKKLTAEENATTLDNLKKEGSMLKATVTLDTKDDGGNIYNATDFEAAWEAANKSNSTSAEREINLGAPVEVESLELTTSKHGVTISGETLTVGTLTVGGAEVTIENLVADEIIVEDGKTLMAGNVATTTTRANGAAASGSVKAAKLTIGRDAEVDLKGITSIGTVVADDQVTLSLEGNGTSGDNKSTIGSMTIPAKSYGKVTLSNLAVTADFEIGAPTLNINDAVVFEKKFTVPSGKTVNVASGKSLSVATLTNNGAITDGGTLYLTGASCVNNGVISVPTYVSGSLTNYGGLEANVTLANGTVASATGYAVGAATLAAGNGYVDDAATITVPAGATLTVKCTDGEANDGGTRAGAKELQLVNNGTVDIELAKDSCVSVKSLSGAGVVNVKQGALVSGAGSSDAVGAGFTGDIIISDGATIASGDARWVGPLEGGKGYGRIIPEKPSCITGNSWNCNTNNYNVYYENLNNFKTAYDGDKKTCGWAQNHAAGLYPVYVYMWNRTTDPAGETNFGNPNNYIDGVIWRGVGTFDGCNITLAGTSLILEADLSIDAPLNFQYNYADVQNSSGQNEPTTGIWGKLFINNTKVTITGNKNSSDESKALLKSWARSGHKVSTAINGISALVTLAGDWASGMTATWDSGSGAASNNFGGTLTWFKE